MLRNQANQKFHCKAFTAGGAASGQASSIACTLSVDGGTRAALADTTATEIGATGEYVFDLSQAETDGHALSFVPTCSTAGVQVLGMPSNVIYTSEATSAGESNGDDNSQAIADLVLAALRPTAESFRGARQLQELNSVSIVQRDDYVAADGRAFEWTVVNPAINYTAATVLVGPVGGGTEPNAPTLLGTATLRDKQVGSCTLRIEFSAVQTNVAAGTYNLQALILVSTRRVTSAQISVTVAPAYADAPPP